MKAKVNILAKPHPYIFFTLQLMLLDHISLVPEPTCGRRKMAWGEGKWPGVRLKLYAMYINDTIISLQPHPNFGARAERRKYLPSFMY